MTNGIKSTDGNADELRLDAFRYVSGEMNEVEACRFEDRLASEQWAREAVALAVQIGEAVAVSGELCPPVASPDRAAGVTWNRRRLWSAVAATAAVAFLAGVGISRWFEPNSEAALPSAFVPVERVVGAASAPADTTTDVSSGAVLALWSESATEFATAAFAAPAFAAPAETEAVDGDERENGEAGDLPLFESVSWDADDEEFNVPSWMLAAVSPDDAPEAATEEN